MDCPEIIGVISGAFVTNCDLLMVLLGLLLGLTTEVTEDTEWIKTL